MKYKEGDVVVVVRKLDKPCSHQWPIGSLCTVKSVSYKDWPYQLESLEGFVPRNSGGDKCEWAWEDEIELAEEITAAVESPEWHQQQSVAYSIVREGADCLVNRASERDKPNGERSMQTTIKIFEATSGVKLTEEQGWLFMVCLKLARSQGGAYKRDDYADGAAYFGLMGEAAEQER